MVTYAAATNIPGPSISPRAIASRIATSLSARYAPTSRTVVKPDSSIARALGTDSNAISAADFLRYVSGSPLPFSEPSARCVWQSISPSNTVMFERSTTLAPTGMARSFSFPTAAILSPLIMMIWSERTVPESVSISFPALTTVNASTCFDTGCGWDCDWAQMKGAPMVAIANAASRRCFIALISSEFAKLHSTCSLEIENHDVPFAQKAIPGPRDNRMNVGPARLGEPYGFRNLARCDVIAAGLVAVEAFESWSAGGGYVEALAVE